MSDEVSKAWACKICKNGYLNPLDVPGQDLYACVNCQTIHQRMADGMFKTISDLLQQSAMGDDRVRAATSTTQVSSVRSFLEEWDGNMRLVELQIAETRGALRTLLSQIENRVDFVLSKLTGMDLAGGDWPDVLSAVREVRNMVSTLPARSRGLTKMKVDDAPTSD